MKITTQGNGIRIGTRLESKISDKMAKFDRFFGDEGSIMFESDRREQNGS